jgi:menaquinone-dependent protoporphyrinogen IX oxidase
MAKKILVAYTTNAGSTQEVAETIGETLSQDGVQADVRRIKDVGVVSTYDAVLVGGPMIMGWHKASLKFLRKHQKDLSQVPVAYFFTAMSLTKTAETGLGTMSIYQDPALAKAPENENKLSFKEKHATVGSYLKPALKKAPLVKPVSAGFFAGKLDYSKLNAFQMLFVMLIIGAQPGDRRNWEAIRDWASSLRPALLGS